MREEVELAIANFSKAVLMIDDFNVPDDPGYRFDDYGPGKRLDIDARRISFFISHRRRLIVRTVLGVGALWRRRCQKLPPFWTGSSCSVDGCNGERRRSANQRSAVTPSTTAKSSIVELSAEINQRTWEILRMTTSMAGDQPGIAIPERQKAVDIAVPLFAPQQNSART